MENIIKAFHISGGKGELYLILNKFKGKMNKDNNNVVFIFFKFNLRNL